MVIASSRTGNSLAGDTSLESGTTSDPEGSEARWQTPQSPFVRALAGNEVHVWRAGLDRAPSDVPSLWNSLSAAECDSARRYHFLKDRDRFVLTRGLLRFLIGHYLKIDACEIRLDQNFYGKLFLNPAQATIDLRFNVSHSHDQALFAFSQGLELGVDIERVIPEFATEDVAERFFSSAEVASLRALPVGDQVRGFFNCWTRKEAYIKAKGMGLSLPLDQFAVSLAPGAPANLLSAFDDPFEPSRWRLLELSVRDDYAAAVAVEGDGWQLSQWDVWKECLESSPM